MIEELLACHDDDRFLTFLEMLRERADLQETIKALEAYSRPAVGGGKVTIALGALLSRRAEVSATPAEKMADTARAFHYFDSALAR